MFGPLHVRAGPDHRHSRVRLPASRITSHSSRRREQQPPHRTERRRRPRSRALQRPGGRVEGPSATVINVQETNDTEWHRTEHVLHRERLRQQRRQGVLVGHRPALLPARSDTWKQIFAEATGQEFGGGDIVYSHSARGNPNLDRPDHGRQSLQRDAKLQPKKLTAVPALRDRRERSAEAHSRYTRHAERVQAASRGSPPPTGERMSAASEKILIEKLEAHGFRTPPKNPRRPHRREARSCRSRSRW